MRLVLDLLSFIVDIAIAVVMCFKIDSRHSLFKFLDYESIFV